MEKRKEIIKGLKTKEEYKKEMVNILKDLPEVILKNKGIVNLENADIINNYMIRLHELYILLEVLNDEI